jgi:hypothetical protein
VAGASERGSSFVVWKWLINCEGNDLSVMDENASGGRPDRLAAVFSGHGSWKRNLLSDSLWCGLQTYVHACCYVTFIGLLLILAVAGIRWSRVCASASSGFSANRLTLCQSWLSGIPSCYK